MFSLICWLVKLSCLQFYNSLSQCWSAGKILFDQTGNFKPQCHEWPLGKIGRLSAITVPRF